MGSLTIPVYAYYLARGRERKDPAKSSAWNDKSEKALNVLFELFDHPLIKEIAVREGAVSARFPDANLRQSNWRIATMVEEDRFARPKLDSVLNDLQNRGTVVVPSIGHLKGNHKLMRRLCDHPIAPVSIDRARIRIALVKRALLQQPEGRPTNEFTRIVCDFFAWLIQSALKNQRLLETSRQHYPKTAQPAIRRKRSPKRLGVKKPRGAKPEDSRTKKRTLSN